MTAPISPRMDKIYTEQDFRINFSINMRCVQCNDQITRRIKKITQDNLCLRCAVDELEPLEINKIENYQIAPVHTWVIHNRDKKEESNFSKKVAHSYIFQKDKKENK